MSSMLCFALLLLLLLWAIRVAWLLHERRARPPTAPVRTLAVLGSGGHTSEMLGLLDRWDRESFNVGYVIADTDTYSRVLLRAHEEQQAAQAEEWEGAQLQNAAKATLHWRGA